jgi:hypothetical protein
MYLFAYKIIYIHICYSSPRAMNPLVHLTDQPTSQPTEPGVCARPIPACAHAWRSPHAPLWPRVPALTPCPPRSKPCPDRADSTPTAHAHDPVRLSHFCASLSHFDKVLDIFQFQPVILLHCCHSAQSFLLQCSAILENSVIPHCYSS